MSAWWRGVRVGVHFKSLKLALTAMVVAACTSQDIARTEHVASHPTPLENAGSLVREGEAYNGSASLVASAALEQLTESGDKTTLYGGWFVTAQKNDQGKTTVTSWRLNDDGTLHTGSSWTSRYVTEKVAVAGLGLTRFALATIEGGALTLRSFTIDSGLEDSTGAIRHIGSYSGEAVTDLAMTRLPQADPAILQVALALRRSDGTLKAQTFAIDSTSGELTARSAAVGGTVKALAIAAPLQPYGLVVTPVVTADDKTKLISFTANASGDLTRRTDIAGGTTSEVSSISATAAGYQRIAVADIGVDANGVEKRWVRLVQVETDGSMSVVNGTGIGTSRGPRESLELIAGGGGRLFLAGRDADGELALISYSVADRNNIDDVAVASAGDVEGVSAVVLKASRLITPVITNVGSLKAIAWRDYNVTVARAVWPETLGAPVNPPAPAELQRTFAVDTGFGSLVDLTIAAGDDFVLTGSNGRVHFLDKAGNRLPPKYAGGVSDVRLRDMFAPLLSNTTASGAVNYKNLNRYLEFQYACDPNQPNAGGNKCAFDVYDSSVMYDPVTKRFIIGAQARHIVNNTRDDIARYAVFAVSKTADPRDGFYLFGNTESVLRDMPQWGIAAGMLILTWNGDEDSYLRPSAILYDIDDLLTGDLTPRSTKISSTQTDGYHWRLTPVRVRGTYLTDPPSVAALSRASSTRADLFVFKKDFSPPVDVATERGSWPVSLSADGHPHLPRLLLNLPVTVSGSYYGRLVGTGLVDGSPGVANFDVEIDPSNDLPTVTFSLPAHETYPCEQGFTCRLPVIVNAREGPSVLVYGAERTQMDARPASWLNVRYRYGASGAEKIWQAGLSQNGLGKNMDFVEAAPDPEGSGIWAIYKYASASGHGIVAGRIMP